MGNKQYTNYNNYKTEEVANTNDISEEVKVEETPKAPVESFIDKTVNALLNLRKEPSLDSEVLAVLNADTIVMAKLGDEVNGFTAVQYENMDGWCKSEFLD